MLLIRKSHKNSSFLMRNLRMGWPFLVLPLMPIFIYAENPIFWVIASALVFIIGVIQNERKNRYFIEEISINGTDVMITYYRYNTRHVYSGTVNQGSVRINDRYPGFKWREPVLELTDGTKYVLQFCVLGWTQEDFEKMRSAGVMKS